VFPRLSSRVGGHLEYGESWSECVSREVEEETGLAIPPKTFRFVGVTNDVMRGEDLHYITLFLAVDIPADAVPINVEPEKCERKLLGFVRCATACSTMRAPRMCDGDTVSWLAVCWGQVGSGFLGSRWAHWTCSFR
jgi:ADP-ribose pyrophosphatase YjhB (NUDIX family)